MTHSPLRSFPSCRLLFSYAAAVAVLLLLCAGPLAAQPPATPVGVDRVEQELMSQTLPVIGRIVSLQGGRVAARSEGPVKSLQVQVGDRLSAGDVIVELDTQRLNAYRQQAARQVEEYRAQLATAKAVERLARKQLDRLERLRGSPAFSESSFDEQLQQLDVARARRQEAEARLLSGEVNLQLTQINLDDGLIRAPYSGTVVQRHTSEGAWLQAGDPVVTLINEQNLEIEADVPADRLRGLMPGRRVTLLLGDGSRHQAEVRALVPDENPASRTRPVRFKPLFNEMSIPLAVNQDVTLQLPASATSEVVSVSKDAVIYRGERATVFIVQEGKAEVRPITLGEAIDGRFQVLQGLAPGDIVVVRGNERLRPGQAVSYRLATVDADQSQEQLQ